MYFYYRIISSRLAVQRALYTINGEDIQTTLTNGQDEIKGNLKDYYQLYNN